MIPQQPLSFGKFVILSEIGRGGFGTVYRARDTMMDSPVALKVLAPHLLYDPEFVERFKREAQLARTLKHPNIVIIYDLFVEQGMNFIVMELIEGAALNKLIHPHAPLAFDRIIRIATQVADALDYAHSRGVLHRDIKPSNILVGGDNHVTLTDFGLAKAASNSALTSKAMLGTPSYMSPEQAEGGMATASSDLYSLGAVVYEMLTGNLPFKGETPLSVLRQIADKPVLPPSQWRRNLPAEMDPILLKALSKQPTERYASGKEFTQALTAALDVDERKKLEMEARGKREGQEKAIRDSEAERLAAEKAREETNQPQREQAERAAQRQQKEQARIERERRAREAEHRRKWIARIVVGVLVIAGIGWPVFNFVSGPFIFPSPTAAPPTRAQVASNTSSSVALLPTTAPTGAAPRPTTASTAASRAPGCGKLTGAATPKAGDLGSIETPIVITFVPSVDVALINKGGTALVDCLTRMTGLTYKMAVGTSEAASVEALGSGKAHFGFLNTFAVLLAKEKYDVDVLLVAQRVYGVLKADKTYTAFDFDPDRAMAGKLTSYYKPEYFAKAGSGIKTLADAKGKSFCFTTADSTSGGIIPRAVFKQMGIDPDKDLKSSYAGGHDKAAIAVYDGTCDAGAAFMDILTDRATNLVGKYPDLALKVQVFSVGDRIPNDGLQAIKGLDPKVREGTVEALMAMMADPGGNAVIKGVYNYDAFEKADYAKYYGPFNETLKKAGLDIASLVRR